MAEPLNAGHVEVAVESDTTGFGQELQAKIDAAVRNVFARVGTKLDARGLRGEVARAAREASARQAVEIRARVAAERLRDELGRFVDDAEARTRAVRVGINVDGRQVRGEVSRAVREAEAAQQINVEADVRTRGAKATMRRFRQEEEHNPIRPPVEPDTKRAGLGKIGGGGGLTDLVTSIKVPAVAAGLNLIVSGLSSVAAASVSVVGSLSPVVGLLGAVPGVALGAAAGFAAIKLATGGLGDAVGALTNRERGASAASAQALSDARQREAATERVRQAQLALADAVQAQADRQVQAARRVRDTAASLVRAQEQERDALEALNDARADAVRRLEDLRRESARANLDEERARLNLAAAEERLEDVNRSVTATDLDRQEAALAVAEAQQDLSDAQAHNTDVAKEQAEAEKKGVDGSDEVVAARRRVRDAHDEVRTATEAAADAQREAAQSQERSARDVAEAQRDVAKAMRDLGDLGKTKIDKVATALDKLSPAGRRFARVLVGYLPLVDRLKQSAGEALFPRLETALVRLVRLQPTVQRALSGTAGAIGDVAVEAATLVSSGPFASDLGEVADTNARVLGRLGHALVLLLDGLRHVAIAAQPMLDRLSSGAVDMAEGVRDFTEAGRNSGSLARFFDKAVDKAGQLFRIVGNVSKGLGGLFGAGDELGGDLLDGLERLTGRFADFTNSITGRNTLAAYFEGVRPVLTEVGALVGDIFAALADRASSPELAPLIEQVRTQLLPALLDLADTASRRLAPTLIDLLTAFVRLKAEIPLDPFVTMLGAFADLMEVVAALLRNVPGLSTAVGVFAALAATSKGIQFAGKATGVTAFVNAISGKGEGALSNFVRGLRDADGASDTLAGRLGKRVGPALSRLGDLARSGADKVRGLASAVASSAREFLTNAINAGKAAAAWVAQKVAAVASTVATWAQTAAQTALNFVMSLNPITLIVLALVALVAIFVVAYKKSETFRNIVNGAFRAVLGVVQGVWNWIKRNWPLLLAILTGPIGAAVLLIVRNWDKIKAGATAVKDFVMRAFNGLKDGLARVFNVIKDVITKPFDAVRKVVKGAINFVLDGVRTLLRAIGKIKISIPKVHVPGTNIDIGGGEVGLPDMSGLVPPNLARGATIRPTPGGTLVRVAEAGRSEAVVDEGLLNRRLAELEAGPRVVFEAGAIVVHNPVPEPASRSINARMRALEALGIFGADPEPVGV